MYQKLFSKFKFRIAMISALAFFWWWVKRLQKLAEQDLSKQSNLIVLPETDTTQPSSPLAEEISRQPAPIPAKNVTSSTDQQKPEDDLRRIEGIGPKIASILHQAGIESFKQLSEVPPEEIKAILTKAKIRLAQPDTWPEQALLAADGNWAALETLQSQLKGGRRA
jgi:predicted flap endonuclease-1-like 5' DNA nuclease